MGGFALKRKPKKENILDGFGNDQFINQMLQSNSSTGGAPELPELGLVDDLGMDTTDIKPSINPLSNPSPAAGNLFQLFTWKVESKISSF